MSFIQENETYLANLKKYFKDNELTDNNIGIFFSHFTEDVLFLRSVRNQASYDHLEELIFDKINDRKLSSIITYLVFEFNQKFDQESDQESIQESEQESIEESTQAASKGYSNIDEDFLNTMNLLKYSFFHLTEFESFSRIYQYNRPQEVLNGQEISIDFPTFDTEYSTRSNYVDVPTATPFLIEELKKHLGLDTIGYKIVDVHSDDNKCQFTIPLGGKYKIKRNTDAVIVAKSIGDKELSSSVCVGIEFKYPSEISDYDSHKQLLLKFIGAHQTSANKKLPILFVSTDLDTFKFVWLRDQGKRTIHCYETGNVRYAINRIKEFVYFHQYIVTNQDKIEILFDNYSIWTPENDLIECERKANESSTNESEERRKKAEEAYKRYSNEDKLDSVQINFGGTKFVYKIDIDNTPYIFKICRKYSIIYDELEKEADIYKYLANFQEEIGDCIPKLYYAGDFLKTSFIIVTKFIEGRHPQKNWIDESDVNSCIKVLRKINDAGVLHGDPRTANFFMTVNPQKMDNGKILVMEEKAIILDFRFSKNLFFRQEEKLATDASNE